MSTLDKCQHQHPTPGLSPRILPACAPQLSDLTSRPASHLCRMSLASPSTETPSGPSSHPAGPPSLSLSSKVTATQSPSSTRIQEAGAGPTHRSWDPHGTSRLQTLHCAPAEWEETHAVPGRGPDNYNGERLPRPPATQTDQPPKGNPKLPPQFLRSLRIPRQWMSGFLMRAMQSSSTVKSITSGPSHQSAPKVALG